MKRLFTLALSLGVLALPAGLDAQQPYFFEGIPGETEYLEFLSGSGVNGGYGVQVGPYKARFNEPGPTTPASPMFSIYCVDYTHYARSGRVNVTPIATPIGTDTRLDNYLKYQKAAYLSSLFDPGTDVDGYAGADPTTRWGGIHAAIWKITSGVTVGNDYWRNYYLGLATANAASFDTRGWYILTPEDPTDPRSGQEFLMRTVSVPEPATFMLLATGLIFLGIVSRRRLVLRVGDA
jgi:hypothetical protein